MTNDVETMSLDEGNCAMPGLFRWLDNVSSDHSFVTWNFEKG